MTKFNVSGDPSWAGFASNLLEIANPKTEAEGAALRARRASFEADARYNAARAAGVEDQNSALGEAYLKAAGYTDQEIAAMRAARSGSVYDIAHGTNAFRGRTALEAGKMPEALTLLGQASALDDFNKGLAYNKLMTNLDGSFNYPLAAAVIGGAQNVGGNLTTLSPKGWVLGAPTEQGKVYQGTVTNNANESAAAVGLTNAKTTQVNNLGTAKVGTEEARTGKIEGDTANAAALTEGQLADIVARGATRDRVADARIETEQERAARIRNATEVDTAKGNASVEATKGKAQTNANKDAADAAGKQATTRAKIDRILDSAYGQRTKNGKAWALLDPAQKRAIVDYATEEATRTGDIVSAIRNAETAHNVTGETTEGQTGWIIKSGDGVLRLNGFKKPASSSPVADAVAPVAPAAPAKPAAPPTKAAVVAPTSQAAPAASGEPVRITNDEAGKAAYARLPSGAQFTDPEGNLRRKP
jgi:hypothetical protein